YTHGTAFNIDDVVLESFEVEPQIALNANQACVNQTVVLGNASNYYVPENHSVEWILPAGATFVGGTGANDQTVRVRFANPGNQTVTLRITACDGTTSSANVQINVAPCTPQPAFGANFSQICSTNPPPVSGAPTVVTLTDQTNFPASYTPQWTFVPNTVGFVGGTNANSPNPQVSFNAEGIYTVRLTINSPGNNSAFVEQTINVVSCECNFIGGGATSPQTVDTLVFYENFEPQPLGAGNSTIQALTGSGGWTHTPQGTNVWVVNNSYAPGGFCTLLGIVDTPNQAPITNHVGGLNSYYLHINATSVAANCPNANFEVPGNGAISRITTPVINTSGVTGVTISYWYLSRGGGGAPQSAGWAEYSTNGGTTWLPLNLAEYVGVTNWTEAVFAHDGTTYNFDNQSNLRLRFSWRTGPSGNEPSFSLDDIRVRGVYQQPGTGGTPAEPGVYTCPIPSPLCPGTQITVNFNGIVSGGNIFGAGDAFTVQLSDATGSFASPTILGITDAPGFGGNPQDSTYAGQLVVTLPANTPPGSGYRIRVISNNPNTNNNFPDNGADIVVLSQPLSSPDLTGPTAVCPGTIGSVYTVSNAAAMASGAATTWELVPAGAGTLTPQGTSASVQWLSGTTATVRVRYQYACGSVTDEVLVTILPPAPNPAQISGPNAICDGQSAVYSVPAQNNTTYDWTVFGGDVVAGAGTNQITVQWNTPGSGFVQISLSNQCGGPLTTGITVNVQPGAPTTAPISVGEDTICAGQTSLYFSATEAQIYEWRIEPPGAGTLVNAGQFAEIAWNATPTPVNARVFFRPRNACGAGAEVSFDVYVEAAASSCAFSPNPAGVGTPVTLSFTATGAEGPWNMNFTLETETGDSTGTLTVLDGVVYPYDLFTRAFSQPGTYSFAYSASNGRCVVSGTCQVTVASFLLSAFTPQPETLCLSATTNGAFNLPYQASADFNFGNGLHIEISDAQGNFTNPPTYVTATLPASYPTTAATGTVPGLIPQNLAPGTYSVRVVSSDPPAVSNFVNITVTTPPAPGLATADPPAVCAATGQNVTLTVSGHTGQVIRWESSRDGGTTWTALPASSSPFFTTEPITATTIFRAVTQQMPCDTVTASVTVQATPALPPIIAQTDKNVVCIGESVTLETTIQGAAPLCAYRWQRSTGGGMFENIPGGDVATLTHTPTTTADYRVIVTPLPPNVCPGDTSVPIRIHVGLPPTPGTPALITQTPICSPGNFQIVATGSRGRIKWESSTDENGPFAFEQPEGETLRVSNKLAGRYWYRAVAVGDTCPDTLRSQTVAVEVFPSPVAAFVTPKTTLFLPEDRHPVFTDASIGEIEAYEWDFGNGQTFSGRILPSQTPTYSDAGTYTVRLRVRNIHGCEDDTSVTLRVEDGEFVTAPNIF
ncbi:MAG: PKD domain-containing protein, partial [Bacteroidia bacterium]|nr:PKD domain-containing protein [Bacteroidia bacterium]